MIQPWKIEKSEPVADCRIFKVRKDTTINPRTGQPFGMFVLEQPNWVNVIPLTDDGQVVMVEQWRHGTRTVELETPGGLIEGGESPLDCARRELAEETGYEAGTVELLGKMCPNPAIQSNTQYFVLARGCRLAGKVELDHAEDIAVKLAPLAEVPGLIRSGKVRHGIVIAGFYWLGLKGQGV